MGFGCEVDDAIDATLLHERMDGLEVADIRLHEAVVRLVLYVPEVFQASGVGQLIDVNYLVIRIVIDKASDYVTADEAGASGYYDGAFHSVIILLRP